MTELRDLFDMTTKHMRPPELDPWKEQERLRQRRERRKRIEVGIVVLVIIASLGALVGISFRTAMPAHEDLTHTLQAPKPGIWIVDPVSDTIRFVWGPSWLDHRYSSFGNTIGAPTMSPSGDRIAFAGKRHDPLKEGLWTVSSTGQDPHQVGPLAPIRSIGMGSWQPWSHDGRSLLFVSVNNVRTSSAIYRVNADGGGLRMLESMRGEVDHADWSPEGTRVVFDHDGGIYVAPVMQISSAAPTLLARGNTPTWSPDGRWIAFSRRTTGLNGHVAIWLVHPDGTDAHPISSGLWAVGWSPDGSQLAILRSMTATMAPGPHVRTYAIVDVATGEERTIDIEAPDAAQMLFQWPAQG
jgi:Tol biopolymer transport system component